MILQFKNNSNQVVTTLSTKFNTVELNLDIDFESIVSGNGRILHNSVTIGTFVRTAGSPVQINLISGNFTRTVNHGDVFTLVLDQPSDLNLTASLTIDRAHVEGTPKLASVVNMVMRYLSDVTYPFRLTNSDQKNILTKYNRPVIPKHMSTFVRELMFPLKDIYHPDASTFLKSDAFYCSDGVALIIPVADILSNDKVRSGGSVVDNQTTDSLELIGVKSSNGCTVTPTLFNGKISSLRILNTLPVGSVASFICEIKNKITNETFDSPVTVYIKSAHPINAIGDVYNLTQWEILSLSISQILSNDAAIHTPITFVEIIPSSAVNGTVSLTGSTISFQSTGLVGQPASFQYRIKDANNNTAVGTVNINILELPEVEAYIWETSSLLSENLYEPPTFLDVFNTWPRFCHDPSKWDDPADSLDLDYWVYEAAYDRVRYNLHAHPRLNGLYSLEPLENYVHQATITGTDDDSGSWDSEGLVIAVNEDASGNLHTLTLQKAVGQNFVNYNDVMAGLKTAHEVACGYAIVYDCLRPTEWLVQQSRNSVPPVGTTARGFDDGINYNLRLNPNGFTLKVERIGDTIRCWASALNSLVLDPATELTIDLNSDPRLAQFKGKKPYGYCVFSQPAVTWVNVSLVGGLNASKLYDMEANVVWEYINSTWVNTGQTIQQELGYPRTVTNPKNGFVYRIEQNSITKLN